MLLALIAALLAGPQAPGYAALYEGGVTFEAYDLPGLQTVNGIATMGDTKGAWFKDTEGNIMALIQTR